MSFWSLTALRKGVVVSMANSEQENAVYLKRIDEIAERFKNERTYYAKEWLEKLTSPYTGDVPSDDIRRDVIPPVCIWGAGAVGQTYCSSFFSEAGIPVACFCDNNAEKWGREIWESVKCISPKDLSANPCYRIVIAANGHQNEIVSQCVSLGIAEENIFIPPVSVLSWTANYRCSIDEGFLNQMVGTAKELITNFDLDNSSKELLVGIIYRRLLDPYQLVEQDMQDKEQYFIPEFPLRPDEAFVDAGAYNGDTLAEFVNHMPSGECNMHYYAFECDPKNYKDLQRKARQLASVLSIEVYPVALWSKRDQLCFMGSNASGVVIDEPGKEVQADRLDDVLAGKKVSWIKMDIEGAEMQALAGCAATIRTYKPRLAICVYHKIEDILEIPRYIKTLREDYRFLLRHHSAWDFETVLYAF